MFYHERNVTQKGISLEPPVFIMIFTKSHIRTGKVDQDIFILSEEIVEFLSSLYNIVGVGQNHSLKIYIALTKVC